MIICSGNLKPPHGATQIFLKQCCKIFDLTYVEQIWERNRKDRKTASQRVKEFAAWSISNNLVGDVKNTLLGKNGSQYSKWADALFVCNHFPKESVGNIIVPRGFTLQRRQSKQCPDQIYMGHK